MKIGIDVLGGDFAPDVLITGAILAKSLLPSEVKLVLFGDQELVLSCLLKYGGNSSDFEIIHAPERITMQDHPTKAIANKPSSSIAVGFDYLASNRIQAFASNGNSGAMLVGAIYKINTIPGVIRPCITAVLPTINDGSTVLLDVGLNADCKADVLYQFGVLGSLYAKNVYGIENPKVALLNIGEEESKGNLLTVATYKLFCESDEVNFIGNIEGRAVFTGVADVIVCDGFTGNVVLKEAEGIYSLIKQRGIVDAYFERFNYENYGGSPILGVKGNVIIGHGVSNDKAVKSMILHAHEVAKSGLAAKVNEAFN